MIPVIRESIRIEGINPKMVCLCGCAEILNLLVFSYPHRMADVRPPRRRRRFLPLVASTTISISSCCTIVTAGREGETINSPAFGTDTTTGIIIS